MHSSTISFVLLVVVAIIASSSSSLLTSFSSSSSSSFLSYLVVAAPCTSRKYHPSMPLEDQQVLTSSWEAQWSLGVCFLETLLVVLTFVFAVNSTSSAGAILGDSLTQTTKDYHY